MIFLQQLLLTYFDLVNDKGFSSIIRIIKRVCYIGEYYTITVQELNLRLMKKINEDYQIIKEVIQPTDSIFNVYRSV